MDQQHTLTFISTGPDRSKVPEVPAGDIRGFIIAARRKHDGQVGHHDGEVRTFCAWYLNGYRLQYEDQCPQCPGPDEDGNCPGSDYGECPTTGWFRDESSLEYENCYYRVEGDVLAFAEIPAYIWPEVRQTAGSGNGGE